jgi:heme A synthase
MQSTFARFSWGVLAYNLAVIVWGAFVRATGSGAGCGAHWPMCNGEVLPREPSLETVIELTHRATSGLALILVVLQLIWALRLFPRGHRTRSLAIATTVLMCLEALIGAGIVLLELVADDRSTARAGWIAMHLVNTFLLVASLTLTPWSVTHTERAPSGRGGLTGALSIGAIVLLLIGVAGAITALGDTLFPAESLASGMAADLSPTAHFLVRLRVIHPVLAAVGGVYLLGLAGFLATTRRHGAHGRETRRMAIAVASFVVLELVAGLVNLALLAPVWMQLVHLVLADLLWIAFVLLGDAASHTSARPAEVLGTAEVPR